MSKIRFLNVPRSYRRSLNGTRVLRNSKAIEVKVADSRVRALARKLPDNNTVNLGLEIDPENENKEKIFTISDAYIEQSDQNLGLRSIADRLCNDSRDKPNEQEALKNYEEMITDLNKKISEKKSVIADDNKLLAKLNSKIENALKQNKSDLQDQINDTENDIAEKKK
ncbi:hypothetical protein DS834_07940 [Lactobacillus bombicola]|uniref:DUF536 domain-containing protein n=1 Tax=Lactobacillus bombicola TaxID=1505723 RepID=A0ABX9LU13_9LACO|nr:hypothetical protein [Lactobacillus bombicola]RHW49255.1 hypothetical protein DS834_07940 [Lactobacillus bombicola]